MVPDTDAEATLPRRHRVLMGDECAKAPRPGRRHAMKDQKPGGAAKIRRGRACPKTANAHAREADYD